MNKRYKVIWSHVAENDLLNIIEYIAFNSRSRASGISKKTKEKASNLYFSPERGRVVPELREYGLLQYREITIAPWRIIYRIGEKKVYVLSVIDSRRNIEDILFKRITNSKI